MGALGNIVCAVVGRKPRTIAIFGLNAFIINI